MKLGHIDPELFAEPAQDEPQAPAYRPKFQHATTWAEIERARNPKHYESASYACTWNADKPNDFTIRRMVWKGIPEVPCGIVHNPDHARRYMDWLVTNDKKIHELAAAGSSDVYILLMRGMVETAHETISG
jgi:hypothetical protein